MKVAASIFLSVALLLGIFFGPQSRPWTWGPAMLALAIATLLSLPAWWKKRLRPADNFLLAICLPAVGWFIWQAFHSPVYELAKADVLLLAVIVASFLVTSVLADSERAESWFFWCLAGLLLANSAVIFYQISEPNFAPIFHSRPSRYPSGFFNHYNDAANFLAVASLLLASSAALGSHSRKVRGIWGCVAFLGLSSIYFTRSRGGLLAAAVGCCILGCLILLEVKRRKAKWFLPFLVALPIVGLALGAFLYAGWASSQTIRGSKGDVLEVLTDPIRLRMLGIALETINFHLWLGGGSRSYSWESMQFWDSAQHNSSRARPEYVHNEFVQAATDYGLIGIGLLLIALGYILILALSRIAFPPDDKRNRQIVIATGALAASVALFIQSSFSFVIHLIPGALMLGICLGLASYSHNKKDLGCVDSPRSLSNLGRFLWISIGLGCCCLLFPWGYKGTKTLVLLWPTYFGNLFNGPHERRIADLTSAIAVWPQSALYWDRAQSHQKLGLELGNAKAAREEFDAALEDLLAASKLNPMDPTYIFNLGKIYEVNGNLEEAEFSFRRAATLQGGLEESLQANATYCKFLLHKGDRSLKDKRFEKALAIFNEAATYWEKSENQRAFLGTDVFEKLGFARQVTGDWQGALTAYDTNYSAWKPLEKGNSKCRAALLAMSQGEKFYQSRQPEAALYYFLDAKERMALCPATSSLLSPLQKAEYLAQTQRRIEFLEGAHVVPVKPTAISVSAGSN